MKDFRFCHFYRDKSLTERCVCCSEDERGHNERDGEVQVPQWMPMGLVCRRI